MSSPVVVGSRELKTHLGSYLRIVREGGRLVVTERGRPVAELRGLDESDASLPARLSIAAARGIVTLPSRDGGFARVSGPLARRAARLSRAVAEGRGDRI